MAKWKKSLQDVVTALPVVIPAVSKSFFDMSVDNKKEETKTASDEKAENK